MSQNVPAVREQLIGMEDEISLTDLFRNIWRQRGLIIGCAVFLALFVLIYHFTKASFSVPRQVDYSISLTFLDGKETYPNGSVFSPRDIITPAVVKDVVMKSGLTVSAEQLTGAFSVQYSNSLMSESENRLSGLLANAKTPEEIRIAAETTLNDMRQATRSLVTISLDLSKAGVTVPQGEKLVKLVVYTWADLALQRGLASVDINRPLSAFSVQESLNLIDVYDNASIYLAALSDAAAKLSGMSGASSLVVSGRTLNDVRREMDALDVTDIGPLREFAYSNSADLAATDPAIRVRLYARQRLLNLEHERLAKMIASYDAALGQLSRLTVAGSAKQSQANNMGGDIQLDQSLLSSMLELGSKLGDVEMRQELFRKRTDATEQMLSLEKELAILGGSKGKSYADLNAGQILQGALPGIREGLNRLQKQLNAFFDAYRQQSLQNSGRLFVADAAPLVRGGNVQFAGRIGLHLALGFILGLMLGVLIALIRAAMMNSKAD